MIQFAESLTNSIAFLILEFENQLQNSYQGKWFIYYKGTAHINNSFPVIF